MFGKHTPGRHAVISGAQSYGAATAGEERRRARLSMLGPVVTAAVVSVLFAGGAYVVSQASRATQLEVAPPASTSSASATTSTSASPSASASTGPSPSAAEREQERISRGAARAPISPSPTRSSAVVSTGTCEASFYWEPQPTASGETFDPEAMTAAHKSLPFNTRVRVTNLANNKTVTVRINDRGPYIDGRCLDLARGAFRVISDLDAGVADVRYEVLKD